MRSSAAINTRPDQYVVIDPAEIEKLKTKGDKAISIESFIGCDTIDPRYYSGKHYYLLPDGQVPTVHMPSPQQRQKRRLVHQRRSLVAMHGGEELDPLDLL